GAEGHKPLMEFLAEFLRPGIRLAANCLWFMSGRWRGPCLAREFAWRQILVVGGEWGFGFMYFAWRQN
ncbi:hypothetical protein, partial [Streptomyces lacrimifluminis]|uniref:hypothetical protein n=1 Tax=Streptomyces lacrimifluminis TaxID=1500077 RepID=UPI001E3E9031